MSAIATAALPTGNWTLDTTHSSVGFAVKHLGISTFRSSFDRFDVRLADGTLSGSAEVASLSVGDESLKGHLLSPDFFSADANPTIDFRSTAVRSTGDGAIEVDGELTVAGVTRPVTATGAVAGPVTDPGGDAKLALDLEAVVDRREYGLTWQAELPGGGKALGEQVRLVVHAELLGSEA